MSTTTNTTNTHTNTTEAVKTTTVKLQISKASIKEDLKNGLSRYKKDDFGNGSIEDKYGLTPAQVLRIFKNPELKGLKTKGKTRIKDDFELV